MDYTKGEWKLPCGCSIFLEPNSPPILTYCPKHKAAPDMYEALLLAKGMLEALHIKPDDPIYFEISQALTKAEGKD